MTSLISASTLTTGQVQTLDSVRAHSLPSDAMILASSSLVTPTNQNPGSYAIVESAGATGFTLGGSVPAVTLSPFADTYKEGSMYFPGVNTSNISVSLGSSYNWSLGLTAEAWVYYTSFAGSTFVAGSTVSAPCALGAFNPSVGNSTAWSLGADPNGKLTFYYYGWTGGTFQSANTNISLALNTWNHVAVSVPSGGPLSLYINGIQQTSNANNNGSLTAPSATTIALVGTPFSTYNYLGLGSYATAFTTGYIADARVTYGAALYTGSSFTVPSAPLTIAASGTTVMLVRAGQNSPTIQNGALKFDRGLRQFMNFGPQTFNIATRGFTCLFRYTWNGTVSNFERIFQATAVAGNQNNSLYISRFAGNNQLAFNFVLGGSFATNTLSGTLNQGTNYVVALVFNPSVASGTAQFWVNGVPSGSPVTGIATTDLLCPLTFVGCDYSGVAAFTSASMNTFAVYNRALSNVEIYQSYLALTTTPATPLQKTLEIGDINGTPALSVAGDGKVFMDSVGLTSNVLPWPPAAMTGYDTVINGGVYRARASTELGASNLTWYSFNKDGFSTYWTSQNSVYSTSLPYRYTGTYTTTDANGSVYPGEWVQVQLASSIVLSSYSVTSGGFPTTRSPGKFFLLGSRDGINWFLVDSRSGATYTSPYVNTYTIATGQGFSYYRIVISQTCGSAGVAELGELTLYGTADTSPALTIAPATVFNTSVATPSLTGIAAPGVYVPQDFSSSGLNIPAYIVGSVPGSANGPFAGEGSIYFNGATTNYVNFGTQLPIWTGAQLDVTIEFWFYMNGAQNSYPFGRYVNTTTNTSSWGFIINSGGYLYFNGSLLAGGVVVNAWNHIAVSIQSNILRGCVNGAVSAPTVISTPGYNANYVTLLGGNSGAGMTYGYISNFRIVQGLALYTSAFTPPTGPLQPIQGTTQAGTPYGTVLLLRNAPAPGRILTQKFAGANSGGVLAFPPAPMTGYSTVLNAGYGQGVYVASASSEYFTNYAYSAFYVSWASATTFSSATPGVSTATTTFDISSNSYQGEWIQIQLPSSIILSSYSFIGNSQQGPYRWFVLGSRDGTNWSLVDQRSNASNYSPTVSSSQAFSYFRMVINQVQNQTTALPLVVSIGSLRFNGTIESVNVTPDGRVGLGVVNPTRALEVAGDLVVSGTVSGGNPLMFRNRIINGDMRIAQRGTSLNVAYGGSGASRYFLIDRWSPHASGAESAGAFTMTQDSDVPLGSGLANSCAITVTTAYTAIGWYQPFYQPIEGYNTADFNWGTSFGSPATLSFWWKTNTLGSYCFAITAGTASYVGSFTASSSGAWQYYTFTIPSPPIGVAVGTGASSGVSIIIGSFWTSQSGIVNAWNSGSVWSFTGAVNLYSGVGRYAKLTGVQLEKGTVATPFEFRPFATELALCQRYYSNVSIPAGHTIAVATAGNTNCQIVLPIPVPLRSTPAIATTGTFSFRGASADNIITAFTINSTSQNLVNMTGALTNTAGNGVVGGVMSLNTNVTIALSSEL